MNHSSSSHAERPFESPLRPPPATLWGSTSSPAWAMEAGEVNDDAGAGQRRQEDGEEEDEVNDHSGEGKTQPQ